MESSIITISREYGSGGREIGSKLAEKLGIKFYDNELLDRAAKDSGICQELFENHDEKPSSSFLYSLVMDTYSMGYASAALSGMPINHKVFLAQFNAIKEIAKEGPCVMVGRCADYVLQDVETSKSIFLYAPYEVRLATVMGRYSLDEKKADKLIQKVDKDRSYYYNYYTDQYWEDMENYDVCFDTNAFSQEQLLDLLEALYKTL